MRKFFTLALMASSGFAFAQECPKREICGFPDSFQSTDGMTYNPETKVMEMRMADFSDERITVCQAEKITFDTITREMIIENAQKLEFYGAISEGDVEHEPGYCYKLRYKLGDGIAYLE